MFAGYNMSFLVKGLFDYVKHMSNLDTLMESELPLIPVKIMMRRVGMVNVAVTTEHKVYDLKKFALEEFVKNEKFQYYSNGNEVNESMINKFKLIRSRNQSLVDSESTIESLFIVADEEFLMLPCKSAGEIVDPKCDFDDTISRVTKEQINETTKSVPPSKSCKNPAFPIVEMLFQDDMRKIFVTLAQEAAYVLGSGCHANKLIEYYRVKMHNLISRDKDAVKLMTQLGFEEDRVVHAMDISAGNHRKALDWLIENESPTEYDERDFEEVEGGNSRRSSVVKSSRRNSILSSKFRAPDNIPDRVQALLEIVHFFADTDEIVYPDCAMEMLAMGYSMELASEALKITRNNTAAAVAYIEGERTPSIFEIRRGVAASSEIRKKFLESPGILSSLANPQMFEFYINILHNPTQAREWDRNSDIGQLMSYIITTYHNVKHSMSINQFNQNSQLCISAVTAPNTI